MLTLSDPDTFNSVVYSIVRQIPEGQVSTFGQIASMMTPTEDIPEEDFKKLAPKWVGDAMNITPPGKGIPWQRVINGQGKISLRDEQGGKRQRRLLEEEGVVFNAKDAVDFHEFGWAGPSLEWLRTHQLNAPRPFIKKPNPDDGPQQLSLF